VPSTAALAATIVACHTIALPSAGTAPAGDPC